MSSKTHSLGQGLDALLGNSPEELGIGNGEHGSQALSLDLVRPSSQQPRRHFDETELNELATSIREKGLLQPILVVVYRVNHVHNINTTNFVIRSIFLELFF